MRKNFDAYKFVRKTSVYFLFLLIIGFSFYYLFDTGLDYFSTPQSQSLDQAPDPLDDSGKPIAPVREDAQSMNTLVSESQQDKTSEAQEVKVLNNIKANENVSDIQKQKIMDALSGNKK